MPGAQPRRGPVARVSATARRGANVPAGVPGVYRVPRSRVRTIQSDAGLAGRSDGWVQPDDVETSFVLPGGFTSQKDSFEIGEEGPLDPPGTYYLNYELFDFVASTSTALRVDYPGWSRWETISVVGDPTNLDPAPVSPTPPSGMTVEYESPAGVLLTARLRGAVRNAANAGSPVAGVWEIPSDTLDPGLTRLGHVGPEHDAVGGTQVFLTSTIDTDPGGGWTVQPFDTPWVDFPSDTQRVGWKVATTASAFEVDLADGDDFATDFWGIPADLLDPRFGSTDRRIEYTYRPPRYRFV